MNEFGNCYLAYLLKDVSLQSTYQRLEEVKRAAKKVKRAKPSQSSQPRL